MGRPLFPHIAVLKKVRYALCPMPYTQCPIPNARRVPHVTEKGYILQNCACHFPKTRVVAVFFCWYKYVETLPGISFLTIEVKFNYLFIGKLFLRLGKWLIVLRSIDKIYTLVPAVPYLSSPAKAGCIPMLIFGNALALVYCVNLPNHASPCLHQ